MISFNPSTSVESLYIHWPFCPYKCHFCPFVALASQDQFMTDYHHALKKEICDFSLSQADHQSFVPLKTIFFGGGTPSTYPPNLLLDMFDTLYKRYTFHESCEISIEVNPGTVTAEKIKLWKDVGINRISIGVQSLDDNLLKKLNRHQKASDVYQLMEWAVPIFDNISIDLIIGLPGVTVQDWQKLIETIVTWPIKHVSLYLLMVHEDTPLYFGVKSKRIALPADEDVVDTYLWSIERLARQGFEQYEISNFSKDGYHSQHNSMYWQRKPYKGFGLGACSFDGASRFQNDKNLMNYLKGVQAGYDITILHEKLTSHDVWLETLMLGIRQIKGVNMKILLESLSVDQQRAFNELVIDCEREGLLVRDNDHVKLTPRGRAVEQEIATRLARL